MSTATKVSLNRNELIALYEELGWKTAQKWDNAKCLKNVAAIKDVHDPTKPLQKEENAKLLIDILAGIESKAEFEVVGDQPESTTTSTGTVGTKGKTDEEKAAEAKAKDEEKAHKQKLKDAEKAHKQKLKDAEKAANAKAKEDAKAKKEAEKAAKKEKKPGTRTLGRGYYAGIVLKKHGLEGGINEAMAAEVDALYGTPNIQVSMGALKWAFDSITGFTKVDEVQSASGEVSA